jgi:ubiquitin-protein ligase
MVQLLTKCTEPSINDGRDILLDIINREWTPSFVVLDLIYRFKDFFIFLLENERNGPS